MKFNLLRAKRDWHNHLLCGRRRFLIEPKVIDSHIHLDLYEPEEIQLIVDEVDLYGVEALITVSNNLSSARRNLKIAKKHPFMYAAFGYHPEQQLPKESEVNSLINFIDKNKEEMIAIGEVGLPYYLRKKDASIEVKPYKELLENFIEKAKMIEKPIILHAVYEDVKVVCDLLEKHSIEKAHFHWFKGDEKDTEKMNENRYFISITPDVLYESEIKSLVKKYPLSLMMVETDGPWQFKGPFENKLTHPKMLHEIVKKIASIKKYDLQYTYKVLLENTRKFYSLS